MFKHLTLLNNYIHYLGDFVGLTENQIIEIEEKFNVKLPNGYREFLRHFGIKSGNLFSSYHMCYPSFLDIRIEAISDTNTDDRISDSERVRIAETDFFFAEWQGAYFFFFDLSSNNIMEDSKVYVISGNRRLETPYHTFSHFIKEGLIELLELEGVKYEE